MKARLKRNYHWVIAAVIFLEMTIVGGVLNTFSSIFLIPVTQALNISRGSFGLAFSIKSLCALFSNLAAGILFTRCSYRKLTTFFLFLFAASLYLTSVASSLTILFVSCILMGLCEGFISVVGCARVVGAWFHRNHGLVMGAVTSATGLGGSLYSLILSAIITSSGWKNALFFCAITVAVSGILAMLLVRNKPKDMGLLPYGEGHTGNKKAPDHHWSGYTMAQMLHSPVFYLLMLGTLLSCTCAQSFSTILTPHLQDCGMDALSAAGALSYLYILLSVTKFIIGVLSDRIGPKNASLICLGACVPALCLLASVSGTVSAYVAITVASVALPLTALVAPLLVPYVLGYQCSSIGNGIMLAMAAAGGMLSSILSNFMHDALGSYRPFYWIAAGVSVLVFFLYLFMFSLSEKDKKKYKEPSIQTNEV